MFRRNREQPPENAPAARPPIDAERRDLANAVAISSARAAWFASLHGEGPRDDNGRIVRPFTMKERLDQAYHLADVAMKIQLGQMPQVVEKPPAIIVPTELPAAPAPAAAPRRERRVAEAQARGGRKPRAVRTPPVADPPGT